MLDKVVNFWTQDGAWDIFLSTIVVLVAMTVCISQAWNWVSQILTKYHKKKRGEETTEERMMAMEKKLDSTLSSLQACTDANQALLQKMEQMEKRRKQTDCAILRDRIVQSTKFFMMNCRDEQGQVHIGMTEYENLTHLFEEYFACGGNGMIKNLYEHEFLNWIVES